MRELIERLAANLAVFAGHADPVSFGRPFELLLEALGADEPGRDRRVRGALRSRRFLT